MDNFERALLSVPTLIKDHKAALFHPEHSVVIANATDFDVRYKNPSLLGNLRHGMLQVQMKTSRKAFKTYALIASTPVTSKTQRLSRPRDLLVPCLKRWNSQVIQPQGHKICYIGADNTGESTGVAYDGFHTEIAPGPQYTSRYSKGALL